MKESSDVEKLIAYLAGEMPCDQAEEINGRLRSEPELRELLLALAVDESVLTDWAKSERIAMNLEDEVFSKESHSTEGRHKERAGSSLLPFPYWSVAAGVVLLISLGWLMKGAKTQEITPEVAARVIVSVDADWTDTRPDNSDRVYGGNYSLKDGSVELEFGDGAKVKMSGPAAFEIRSPDHLHLLSGKMVANIPDQSLGFVVTSPHSEVIDLGTEFGLLVEESGETEVHVLEGLVEVKSNDSKGGGGVQIEEGQARRFRPDNENNSSEIPVSSRVGLLGRHSPEGVEFLRGQVRLKETVDMGFQSQVSDSQNWIDVLSERSGVRLDAPLITTVASAGNYRNFDGISDTVPEGAVVDSYLLHFRPATKDEVDGVIRFDRPIVAVICTGEHLAESDFVVGISGLDYPDQVKPFRGLEPSGHQPNGTFHLAPEWKPDEVTLSKDRRTISIKAYANTARGIDQIRVLTLAESAAN